MLHLKTYQVFESEGQLSGTKVVDSKGAPAVWYHGTDSKFDEFDMSYFGKTDDGYYGRGFYFTSDEDEAKEYGSIVVKAHLNVTNPFWLRDNGEMDHPYLLDLRDDLSKLPGMPKGLKTNRELPDGYYVKIEPGQMRYGEQTVEVSVWPKPELYGTDKEEYGETDVYLKSSFDEESAKVQAIVSFNDKMSGNDWDAGWSTQLLKKLGRYGFSDLLKRSGYDGIFVTTVNSLGEKMDISKVVEIVVFDPDQIIIIDK